MSRKHNTKHSRGKSAYPIRLQARGLSKAPKLEALESLQQRQLCKAHQTCREETVNRRDCKEGSK